METGNLVLESNFPHAFDDFVHGLMTCAGSTGLELQEWNFRTGVELQVQLYLHSEPGIALLNIAKSSF